ncbi:MAG: MFS transporter [Haloarculaceae archaeon]
MSRLARLVGLDAALLGDRNYLLLLLGSLTSPLGASVVSPILASLVGPYGTSDASIGLLMSVFTAPAIVAIPLVGALSDRVGRKPVLTAGLALFGLAGLGLAATTDFRVALALRALQGVGYTGIAPVLITSVGDLYDGEREARAQGVRFATVGISLTVVPLAAGALLSVAWQLPFLLYAVALPTAAAVAVWFVEPARGDRGDRDDRDPSGGSGAGPSLRSLASRPAVAALLVGRGVPSFLWFVFLTYNSIVVERLLAGSAGTAGLVVALASLASAVGGTQVGRLLSAMDGRRSLLAASVAATGAGVAGLPLAPSIPVVEVASVVTGAGFGVSLSLFRSAVTAAATDATRGGLVSLGESLGRVGSTTSPLLVGAGVALARGSAGFAAAVRTAVVATALAATLLGVGCVLLATRADAGPAADGSLK